MKALLEGFLSNFKHDESPPACFVVAYSGGVDSTVLLHALWALHMPLHAVHVNHRLQPQANDWELKYQKEFIERAGALDHEMEIKRKKSRKYVEQLISSADLKGTLIN